MEAPVSLHKDGLDWGKTAVLAKDCITKLANKTVGEGLFENADGDHLQNRTWTLVMRGWPLVTCNDKVGSIHLNMSLFVFVDPVMDGPWNPHVTTAYSRERI